MATGIQHATYRHTAYSVVGGSVALDKLRSCQAIYELRVKGSCDPTAGGVQKGLLQVRRARCPPPPTAIYPHESRFHVPSPPRVPGIPPLSLLSHRGLLLLSVQRPDPRVDAHQSCRLIASRASLKVTGGMANGDRINLNA
ncbi:hypothetical protein DPEC_G00149320 [Dallia pectoralis]|uniref:Uncharacterized protein n=1 Tax=Dallia pectoralis TaxID=75939 RepID=A0ACC2GJ49_DALPE|nr:hypothetical protein DPEC_G00149320 [Dallia pectoralis]